MNLIHSIVNNFRQTRGYTIRFPAPVSDVQVCLKQAVEIRHTALKKKHKRKFTPAELRRLAEIAIDTTII